MCLNQLKFTVLIGLICVSTSQVISPLGESTNDLKSTERNLNNKENERNELTNSPSDALNADHSTESITENGRIPPSLQIILIVHPFNKFNELPFVLSGIEEQTYPKNRTNVLILSEFYVSVGGRHDNERSKYNDLTIRLLKSWKQSVEFKYHKFELKLDESNVEDEPGTDYWTTARYEKLMNLKSFGFSYCTREWADYCLFQDADIILTNPNTYLTVLTNQTSVVFSPMLLSLKMYSNFWAGVNENGYYKRTDDYVPILERQKIGVFAVPMIYSFVFIDVRNSKARDLKFRFKELGDVDQYRNQLNKIPFDDIIVFAKSAQSLGLQFYIDNRQIYGFIMPSVDKLDLGRQKQNLISLELECLIETNRRFKVSNSLVQYQYADDRQIDNRIDKIYVINLERRKERRDYMQSACDLLGLRCEFRNAVDGKLIDKQYLIENKIQIMNGYLDPFHKRPMTYGEIGCFMSHYHIWLDILENNRVWSIVFEDDVRFETDFHTKFDRLMHSIRDDEIDFIYLGRKREGDAGEESWFNEQTVRPTYSYWTIGYLISLNGARKLIESRPLDKLVPVDELLPIMYDKHPNSNWTIHFKQRDLIALSVHPLLVQPLHYVGEDQYISDTEDSSKLTTHDEL